MARGFSRGSGGRIILRVQRDEKAVLRSLLEQVRQLVEPPSPDPDADPLARMVGIDDAVDRPDDPVMMRLLPDAYLDDDEASGDFRRFTERSLREGKATNASVAIASLDRSGEKVTLGEGEATAWLGALNDVRLALGTRLGVSEDDADMHKGLADDEIVLRQAYDWLTWLQDSLVSALVGRG